MNGLSELHTTLSGYKNCPSITNMARAAWDALVRMRRLEADLQAAHDQLAAITALVDEAHLAWIDHDREKERTLLGEIKAVASND